jgi:hypothetical protein
LQAVIDGFTVLGNPNYVSVQTKTDGDADAP